MRLRLTLLLWLVAPLALAVDTPSTLLITGNVIGNASVNPSRNDTVIVLVQGTQQVVQSGQVVSDGGLFAVTVRETSAFDGTAVTLQFEKNGQRYQLYETDLPAAGGTPADFAYRGGLVPRRVNIDLYVGQPVGSALASPVSGGSDGSLGSGGDGLGSGSSGGLSGSPSPSQERTTNSTFDVNGDGTLDQLDIDAVKSVVAGDPPNETIASRADVNNDQIVNTRDLIAVIKAVRRAERERRSEAARLSIERP